MDSLHDPRAPLCKNVPIDPPPPGMDEIRSILSRNPHFSRSPDDPVNGHAAISINSTDSTDWIDPRAPGVDAADFDDPVFPINVTALSSIVQQSDWRLLADHGGIAGIVGKLRVPGIDLGIDPSQIAARARFFGSNTYKEAPHKSLVSYIANAAQDFTLLILVACALVSIAVGVATKGFQSGWADGAAILVSVLLVVTVSASSDYQQSIQFRALDKEKGKLLIQVTRSGKRRKILAADLVVGDVVHLGIGDQIPADGLLVHGQSMLVDESGMTGESEMRAKSPDGQPFLVSGTKIGDGSGVMIVTGVGMNTEWGYSMSILSGEEQQQAETPLQHKLQDLATLIGKIGFGSALVIFLILMGKYLESRTGGEAWSMHDVMKVVTYLSTAVTIVVVAVPEGLPLAVTLSLAFAMMKMMTDKALVRHLAACETMGSATCILCDKTGTLTTNQMTVIKSWIMDEVMVSEHGVDPPELPLESRSLVLESIFQNTSGEVVVCPAEAYEHFDPKNRSVEVIGTPTESALLQFGLDLVDGDWQGEVSQVRSRSKIVRVEPFNSVKKKMGVLVEINDENRCPFYRVHWKGASEIVVGMCNSYLDSQGRKFALDDNKSWELRKTIRSFADEGLRTLCLAFKDFDVAPPEEEPLPQRGFVCLGIVGIKDPVRPGVKEAVRVCMSAGIRVRMVTGDNLYTAMAIARECGILTDGEAVEGPVFRSWNCEETRKRIPKMQVLARSSPSDKHRLVKELQTMGEVVGVTGDGTNDAPALREADIGISMGIAGTEVAKESSDIIILDDNFASIVKVALWGRSVYTNIQKFVQFQATVNLVALALNFWSACSTGDVPLTVIQLLWVNLIMDTLGALALATEPPHAELMKRPPVGRKENFISPVMCRNVLAQSVLQLVVLIVLEFRGLELFHLRADDYGKLVLNTIIFNTFVFFQVFNEFNSREMDKINVFRHLDNRFFLAIVTVTVVFQVVLVEWLGSVATTTPLSCWQWAFCVGIGALSVVVDVSVKLVHALWRKCYRTKCGGSFFRAASCPLIPRVSVPSYDTFLRAKSYNVIPCQGKSYHGNGNSNGTAANGYYHQV